MSMSSNNSKAAENVMHTTPRHTIIIEASQLTCRLGGVQILDGIDMSISRGQLVAIIGGSGAGKTTLLRHMMLLQMPSLGTIKLFGHSVAENALGLSTPSWLTEVRRNMGVLFQHTALFSALTVAENIAFVLREHTRLSSAAIRDVVMLKLAMVGLQPTTAAKYPAELSGGMAKRAALARALALDPALLFLDEPTAGLDPHSADQFDELILQLKASLKLTVVMVTHDLDTLWRITDEVAFLAKGNIVAQGSMAELMRDKTPEVVEYFSGPRAQNRKRYSPWNHA